MVYTSLYRKFSWSFYTLYRDVLHTQYTTAIGAKEMETGNKLPSLTLHIQHLNKNMELHPVSLRPQASPCTGIFWVSERNFNNINDNNNNNKVHPRTHHEGPERN
jgi:hypothetical protein